MQTALIAESKSDDDEPLNESKLPRSAAHVASEADCHQFAVAEVLFASQELECSRNLDSRLTRHIDRPSFQLARAIVSKFRNRQHFLAWLDDFDRDGKQERIRDKGDGYGFYLADAKLNAERIRQGTAGSAKSDGESMVDKLKARRAARGAAA